MRCGGLMFNGGPSFPVKYHGATLPYGAALTLAAAANGRTREQMRKTVDHRRRAGWSISDALQSPIDARYSHPRRA